MKKLSLKLPLTHILLFFISLALSILLFLTQPNTNTNVFALVVQSRGLIFLLNWLPVALVMFFLFFLTGRFVLAAGLGTLIFFLPSVVNRYMVAMRAAPFQPLDLFLGMEFLGIAKSIPMRVYAAVAAGAVLFTVLFAAALYFMRNAKPQKKARIAGTVMCLGLFVLLYFTAYKSENIYAGLPVQGNPYSETNQYQSKGYVYSFIHAVHTSRLAKPPYYNTYLPAIKERAAQPLAPKEAVGKRPHIIFIQSEAFSELPLSPHINFDGFEDPLRHYAQIKAESQSGYIVAPHVGGGTSDMEFDILTGMNTRALHGVPYTFALVKKPFPGVTSALKAQGYDTVAMHPGAGWFYNRQNVYPLLGFDRFMDDRNYDVTDTKGLYITERQTTDKLLEEFEAHTNASGAPLFLFCITIQNHGPYYEKYFKEGQNFNTDLELTAFNAMSLANYFEGVADTDAELRRITDYFSASGEPVVLVFFGDHLPSFEMDVLTALDPLDPDAPAREALPAGTEPPAGEALPAGTEPPAGEQMLKYNRMPFLIWTNAAAKPLVNNAVLEETLPGDRTVSAHYLGAALLEMAGIDSGDPFLDYVNSLRGDYPVVLDGIYRPRDGENGSPDMLHFDEENASVPPGESPLDTSALDYYNSWVYYRITQD